MTTPSEPSLVQLWLHGGLDLSEQLQKEAPQRPAEDDDRRPAPRRDMGLFNLGVHRSLRLYNVLAGLLCGVLAVLMLLSGGGPAPLRLRRRPHRQRGGPALCGAGHGGDRRGEHRGGHDPGLPRLRYPGRVLCAVHRHVRRDHPAQPLRQKTLAPTARCGGLCLGPHCGPHVQVPDPGDPGVWHLHPAQRLTCPRRRLLRRLHSGGRTDAVCHGVGDSAASTVLRPRRLQTVVLCSLGFYCLAKSYSFYTGANHLHSIISPGTPGRILSAGLILPLNVAVGFVVCCTMYSFYMYFRRGEL